MSDSEDDYMSDKVLMGCVKEDVRPGLVFSSKEKRKLELYKKNQELIAKKPKTYKEQEIEAREKGLNTAISTENKGFKLLAKMGYKAGESLGKSQTGLKEPINVIVKEDTSGVGKLDNKKSAEKRKQLNEKMLENQLKDFRASKFQEGVQKQIKKDLYSAQRACENLDYKNNVSVPIEEYYWRPETIRELKAKEKSGEEDEQAEEQADEEEEEEIDESLNEEKLNTIIEYLRNTYLYCMYCSVTGVDMEDLNSYCPGPFRIDHNDD